MSVWLIEPRDPLIFRDGRPFNATPGARAKTLSFPFPSTLAGAVRTRAGQDESGIFDNAKITELLQVGIRGPVLVELDQQDSWYFPAPQDCFVIQPKDQDEKFGKQLWARPIGPGPNEWTNLEDGLALVSISPVIKSKGHSNAPRFWKWERLRKWLENPANDEQPINLDELGIPGMTPESRIHVKMQVGAHSAEDGMLFETNGLEFAARADNNQVRQFALAVETDADLTEGADFLGGERRTVNWRKGGEFPSCPDEIVQKIQNEKACRLLLVTPAIFEKGYLPEWVTSWTPGVTVRVTGAAVPRYQAVSGWDYEQRHPKASRRLAPAGSVYFMRLTGDDTDIEQFIKNVWMQNISDNEQDRCDGFGLALLGAWNGKLEPLKLEDRNENA